MKSLPVFEKKRFIKFQHKNNFFYAKKYNKKANSINLHDKNSDVAKNEKKLR